MRGRTQSGMSGVLPDPEASRVGAVSQHQITELRWGWGRDMSNLHWLSRVATAPPQGPSAHLATMLRILCTVSLMLIGAMIDRVCWIEKEKQGPCDKQPGPRAGGSWREGKVARKIQESP